MMNFVSEIRNKVVIDGHPTVAHYILYPGKSELDENVICPKDI